MKNLFEAGKLLLLDMAATLFFLGLFLLTHNIPLSVVLGMALGINVVVALNFDVVTLSVTMSIYGIASKAVMFLIGYTVMRTIGVVRHRRRQLLDVTGDRPRDAASMPG